MIDGKSIGLVSFADMRFYRSHKRFKSQAEQSGFFDSISINSELDLPRDYVQRNKDLLNRRLRGFGYWCWKPKIILMELEKNPNLDILFYSDIGNHIRIEGRERYEKYVNILSNSEHDILAFQLSPQSDYPLEGVSSLVKHEHIEAEWTKGDLFRHFGIDENHAHAQTPQIQGCLFAVKNTANVTCWLKNWIKDTEAFPNLFNDEPSVFPNSFRFIEHRHDQSYFSLSLKTKMGGGNFICLGDLSSI